jgi:hypothetical protein
MTCSGRALERQNISILVHTAPSCHSDWCMKIRH